MNYYEQPAVQTFMDTYAPLPFQEMAMLGSAYKKEREQTEAAIDEFRSTYGDFTSMSQKDVMDWNKETIGKIQPNLLQMAADPEKIKSQEFQAGIRSAIRSVDVAKLGALRQSAENLKQRAAIVAKLQTEGRYKRSWDPIDITSWDTSKQGIMTDLSPLEYKNLHDIAAPYAQALKPQYLGKIDRYRYWKGVDENQIRQSLNNAYTDIHSTPQGQAWYNDIKSELAAAGVTDPAAVKEEVMNRLVQSQKDYVFKNVEYDEAALKEDEFALKRSIAAARTSQKGVDAANAPARYTDMIRLDGKRYLNQLVADMPTTRANNEALNKAGLDLRIAMVKGNQNEIASAQANYDRVNSELQRPSLSSAVKNNFEYAIGRKLDGKVNYGELVKGSRSVVDMLSTDNTLNGARSIIEDVANATPKEDGSTSYVIRDSRYLENPTTVITSLDGLGLRKHSNEFDKLLSSGALKNLKIEPVAKKGLFNYTDKNGNFKQKQRVIVTVNEDDIDLDVIKDSKAKWDRSRLRGIMLANGATVKDVDDISSQSVTDRYNMQKDVDKSYQGRSVTTTSKGGKKRYITFEAFVDVPDDLSNNQGTRVSELNTRYSKHNLTSKQVGDIYAQEQADAFYGNSNEPSLDDILD